jgi:hypothetical protein
VSSVLSVGLAAGFVTVAAAQPFELSLLQMDEVTAGAAAFNAFADATAFAAGSRGLSDSITDATREPGRSNASALAFAAGPERLFGSALSVATMENEIGGGVLVDTAADGVGAFGGTVVVETSAGLEQQARVLRGGGSATSFADDALASARLNGADGQHMSGASADGASLGGAPALAGVSMSHDAAGDEARFFTSAQGLGNEAAIASTVAATGQGEHGMATGAEALDDKPGGAAHSQVSITVIGPVRIGRAEAIGTGQDVGTAVEFGAGHRQVHGHSMHSTGSTHNHALSIGVAFGPRGIPARGMAGVTVRSRIGGR